METNNSDGLITPKAFIKKFHLSKHGFSTPIQLNDYRYGFTTTKPYKNVWKNGKAYYSFINFVVNFPGTKLDVNPKRAQLIAHIDLTEKRDDAKYYVSESINKVLSKPINMNSIDDFSVNLKSGQFFDNQGSKISAEKILTHLYDQHLKPTYKIAGIWIRTRLWFWRSTISVVSYLGVFLKYLLWILTGEYYPYDHFRDMMLSRNESRKDVAEKIELKESSSISGFTARPHTILAFCGLHLLSFLLLYLYKVEISIMTVIIKSSFLSVVYTVFTLGMLDRVYPTYSKKLQRYLSKLQWQLNFRSFKL